MASPITFSNRPGGVSGSELDASLAQFDSAINTLKTGEGVSIGQACTAWLSFNGVTPAINDNFNMPTYTDNGVGDFTFDFGSAMANANYQVSVSAKEYGAGLPVIVSNITPTVNDVRVDFVDHAAVAYRDSPLVNVAIMGGK